MAKEPLWANLGGECYLTKNTSLKSYYKQLDLYVELKYRVESRTPFPEQAHSPLSSCSLMILFGAVQLALAFNYFESDISDPIELLRLKTTPRGVNFESTCERTNWLDFLCIQDDYDSQKIS